LQLADTLTGVFKYGSERRFYNESAASGGWSQFGNASGLFDIKLLIPTG
jgi:hypothetical protein